MGGRSWVTRSTAAFGHQVTLMLVGEEGALRASWRGKMDMDTEPVVSLTLHKADGGANSSNASGIGAGSTETRAISRETGHAFDVPRQTEAFLAAIEGRGKAPASAEDGCAAVMLCLAAERSLRSGSVAIETA